ncbi:CoB--CoM heterodisulfide reductase iron-sulfur subunit A family protein [Streptomyces caeni]|uniref:CoB--CoM heterodisulfide reductase iron-sulfur subunit A family protein n=1 Tax=Streptomyces caeni TaxID=2307231 RepID=A0ABW4IR27_9ACTN
MAFDTVAVVGGGPGGLRAAQSIADIGGKVLLIEKRDFLGGTPVAENYAGLTPYGAEAEPQMQSMAEAVTSNPNAQVRLSTEVVGFAGEPGSYSVTLRGPDGEESVDVGAVIVATGFQHFDPGRETQFYGYYEYEDVLTLTDLEAMLKQHQVVRPSTGEAPKSLCFIQCVGSRDRQIGNEYCSKVCCGIASKEAIEVRELLPDCKVYIFYIDMRMYGYWESQIYWPAQEKHHVQYVKGMVTEVLKKGDGLLIRGEDTTMGRPMEIPMDMVVLSVGMEPSAGTRTMARVLGVQQNKYGFIEAAGSPLDPVSTDRDGIYACGAALGPADLEDTVSSASNAAMKAMAFVRSQAAAAAN